MNIKQTLKKGLLLLLAVAAAFAVNAQTVSRDYYIGDYYIGGGNGLLYFNPPVKNYVKISPFHRIPEPAKLKKLALAASPSSVNISAWRFTGPIAGFMYPQNQVVTGLGFGYQNLHWVDSTQRYYTNYSVNAVMYAGGNVTPSINPNNIMSVGVSLGVLNQLILIGPAYNLPTSTKPKGTFGIVFNMAVPLN